MGKIWMTGGGEGADLDVITVSDPSDVLAGKVIVDKDGNPLTGTLALSGNASDAQVLSGQTYYNSDPKIKRTGTLPIIGAVSPTLNAGGSYTVPAGYHNGSGKVTANSLASQTGGTSAPAQILSGYTAWVNGSKITGTMANRGQAQYGGGFGSGTDYYAINAIPEGAYFSNGASWAPEARISKDVLRNAIGITANKILEGQSIADIAGTVKDYSYLATGQVSF